MQRLIWVWAVVAALLQISECSNREGNHIRLKRMRRDVNFLQDKLIQIQHCVTDNGFITETVDTGVYSFLLGNPCSSAHLKVKFSLVFRSSGTSMTYTSSLAGCYILRESTMEIGELEVDVRQLRNILPKTILLISLDPLLSIILQPRPILDVAEPNELCCNTKQHNIGIAFVNGYDKTTGALVNLFEFPKRATNQVGKGITSFLDMIGGRLVGLQK